MNRRLWKFSAAPALACAFVLLGQAEASAQARGGGSPGLNHAMGRTVGVSAGRGNGSVNVGGADGPVWPTTSRPPYEYSEQARIRANNEREAAKVLRDHPDMPARLNTTADELREGYRQAHLYNVFLTFGQYVTATRLAANLGPAYPNVTRTAILDGLATRKSMGRTLRDLGLGKEEAKEAVRRAEREYKESRRKG